MNTKIYRYSGNRHSDFQYLLDGHEWGNYIWGRVTNVWKIGDYGILEYIDDEGKEIESIRYHPFIVEKNGWKDTNNSYLTMEEALVGVIAYRFDGLNSQAAGYFAKMIGLR